MFFFVLITLLLCHYSLFLSSSHSLTLSRSLQTFAHERALDASCSCGLQANAQETAEHYFAAVTDDSDAV